MKRVVHYAAASVPGGLIGHLVLLAARTSKHGYASEVWIRPGAPLDAAEADLARGGAEVRRLTVEGKGDLRGLLALARALTRSDPDILHVHLASPVESFPVILLAGSVARARIVTTEHAPAYHPTERAWSRAVRRAAARRVARVIALSSSDADYLAATFGTPREKIRVMPNGVEIPGDPPSREGARRRFGVPGSVPVLGYVGEIAEKKGLADLVEAMTILGEGGSTPVALIAGDGPFAPELRRRADAAGMGERFRLLGSVRPPHDLYAACDLFVLPSHGEAMPLALLEAMAAGRPVVATRVGGVPEAVRDGVEGRLVPSRDPAALSGAISALLADPEARETMGRSARARVHEAFDVERMAAAACALYDELLAGASR